MAQTAPLRNSEIGWRFKGLELQVRLYSQGLVLAF